MAPQNTIRVAFVDFLKSFNKEDNFITKALRKHVEVVVDCQNPDIVFYSCFGLSHLRYRHCLRIYYTGENIVPNFNICDYAISCCRLSYGGRHLYLPYGRIAAAEREFDPLPPLAPEMARRKFCSFIYSNDTVGRGSQLRREFCRKLMEYSHVDCPGRVLHNMDAPELVVRQGDGSNWHASKVSFLSGYKFNIAFENSSSPGYITEKLMDPFLSNSVPIYWGSEGDVAPFPREAMIVANDYSSLEELVERVREVDNDDEQYMRMLAANPLRHGMKLDIDDTLCEFLLPVLHRCAHDKDPGGRDGASRLARLCEGRLIGFRVFQLLAVVEWVFARGKRKSVLRSHYQEIKRMLRDLA